MRSAPGRCSRTDASGATNGKTDAVAATVLQLSDTHLTAEVGGPLYGIDPDARLQAVVDAWLEHGQHVDLVLLTGDNAEAGSEPAYRRLAEKLAPLNAPTLAIAGNHDDPGELATVFGTASVIEVGGWRVIGVDSARPLQVHGTVDVGALTELLDGLDSRPTLIGIHHPPKSPSTHADFQLIGAADLLLVLADRPHVRAVVSGHVHHPFEILEPCGLQLLGAPSTYVPIDHDGDTYTVPGSCPMGARILHLGDDGSLSSQLFAAEGPMSP